MWVVLRRRVCLIPHVEKKGLPSIAAHIAENAVQRLSLFLGTQLWHGGQQRVVEADGFMIKLYGGIQKQVQAWHLNFWLITEFPKSLLKTLELLKTLGVGSSRNKLIINLVL